MDAIDRDILEVMKMNGRATASEISRKVNLSVPAVSERIRKLEDGNIIEQYTIKVNREKMGFKLMSIIFVNIDQTENIENFRSAVLQMDEVLECHHLAGEYDFMLKVLLQDTAELEHFLSNRIKLIKGVKKSNTLIVLTTLKESINR
ncbi:MAG: Lrp/AsnC family transcriptional regulator, leucine-responsive regulatory protein [Clostridiales bacterium]|jgi:Lrp/AsnC family leucine-responsive transcriptional regulator|nr:Lrp/AsnC family transcriptional regulator, leucine-responsive regulatory protein [Clostridiales bacterium]MDN5299710.1 Lrp/AsnC family transcriptional regulator, leucine-responsive regulatory protein [Clostridiales bacterium]